MEGLFKTKLVHICVLGCQGITLEDCFSDPGAANYVCLSGSERIRAGLEVSELVKGLVGVDYPVFIDDTERVPVIDNVRPSGQIFVAKVVKGARLSVQAANAAPSAQAA